MGTRETVHEYNKRGLLIRSRTWVESPWDPHQAGLMLALAQYDRFQCTGCGLDVRETGLKANQYAYVADDPWICAGCTAAHVGMKKYGKTDEITPAHRFIPERRR